MTHFHRVRDMQDGLKKITKKPLYAYLKIVYMICIFKDKVVVRNVACRIIILCSWDGDVRFRVSDLRQML